MNLGILQARMSSSRLPGKVMRTICQKPMLELQIERTVRCKRMDKLIVATSDQADDNVISDLCVRLSIDCFRGSLNNVLDRFYQAAKANRPDHVTRTTADCPLIDPTVIDRVIDLHIADNLDYTTNNMPPSWPHGLDVEVMRFVCLEEAWCEATTSEEKEHVTPFLRNRPDRFALGNLHCPQDLSRQRWTVDEADDFEFVRIVFERLYQKNSRFTTDDVLRLLERESDLPRINEHLAR